MSETGADTADRRTALARHPVHDIPPIGSPYILGRWHKNRASLKGYSFEARVHAKALFVRNTPRKFLIVGRPRSGTSLLRRLLNQVDGVHCDGEMLHHAVIAPHLFLNRLAGIKSTAAYGSKILSYQIFEVQKIADPAGFLEGLLADDYTLIHVRRDTFDQALSLTIAQAGHGYHVQAGQTREARDVTLDPDLFERQVRHHSAMLDYEDLLFSGLPHLTVQYEDDLKRAETHQPTIDRICAAIGVPSGPVAADLKRVLERTTITNLDSLRTRVDPLITKERSIS